MREKSKLIVSCPVLAKVIVCPPSVVKWTQCPIDRARPFCASLLCMSCATTAPITGHMVTKDQRRLLGSTICRESLMEGRGSLISTPLSVDNP